MTEIWVFISSIKQCRHFHFFLMLGVGTVVTVMDAPLQLHSMSRFIVRTPTDFITDLTIKSNWFLECVCLLRACESWSHCARNTCSIMFVARFESRFFWIHLSVASWYAYVYVCCLSRQPSESTICHFTLNFICICPLKSCMNCLGWILNTFTLTQPVSQINVNSIRTEWFMLVTFGVWLLRANEQRKWDDDTRCFWMKKYLDSSFNWSFRRMRRGKKERNKN